MADYERRGDLDAPFALTKKDERAQRERERLRDAVRCNIPSLTWEQYAAGMPCPGCGRPYRDPEPWEFRGTMHFTDEERARYDAEEALFAQLHGDCHAMRHSVSGSLTTHCGKCCPPPPLSPEQRDTLAQLLGRPTPPEELMKWRLRLYCGHVVERVAHYTHRDLHAAFTGSTSCTECGLDPATIVDGMAVGLVVERPTAPQPSVPAPAGRPRKPTRAALEARVAELEAELKRLQGE